MHGKREEGALQGEIHSQDAWDEEVMRLPRCKLPLGGKPPAEPRECTSAETLFSPALAEIHLHSHSCAPENAVVVDDSGNELLALRRISLQPEQH